MSRLWTVPPEWERVDGVSDWYPTMEQTSLGANNVLGEN